MPIYLNSKQNFSIPNDFDPDFSKNENFLNDPEMLFDRLPQPFHFINKMLNKILNDAYDIIDENFKIQTLESNKLQIQETKPVSITEDFGSIQCIAEVLGNENSLVAGLKNGLAFIDGISQKLIDKWENTEMDIVSINCEKLCQNISILSTIDNNGSGGLVGLINNRLYSLKSFPGGKDGEKPFQITSMCLDENCGYIAVCYDQFKDSEQWVEVHKINRDIWIKELKAAGKNLDEYLAAQVDNQVAGPDQGPDEFKVNRNKKNLKRNSVSESVKGKRPQRIIKSSSILDRNGLRVTGTNVIFKFKYQDSLEIIGTNNFSQIFKQLDSTGQIIGMGLNHCMSAEFVDKLMTSYQMDYPNFLDSQLANDSNLLRIANVRFSKVSGPLIKDVGASQKTESSMMLVWWSQSQHLLIFGLNKNSQKTNEIFSKPDSVRSFSSWIVTCELSKNNRYLAIGLQNGTFILLDILSGITRIIQQISTVALKSIYFLNLENTEFENQTKVNKVHLSIIDTDNKMFGLEYVSGTLSQNSNCVMISNEPGADCICRLSRNSNTTLSIYDGAIIILQDMVTGKKFLKFQLPAHMTVVSPWKPICALSNKTGYLYIQVLINQSEQPTDSEVLKEMSVIYKIELEDSNGDFIETSIFKDELELQEQHSFVREKCNSILNSRYKSHDERQLVLEESWCKLEEILKTLS